MLHVVSHVAWHDGVVEQSFAGRAGCRQPQKWSSSTGRACRVAKSCRSFPAESPRKETWQAGLIGISGFPSLLRLTQPADRTCPTLFDNGWECYCQSLAECFHRLRTYVMHDASLYSNLFVHIYIYICVYTYVYVYIYIYVHIGELLFPHPCIFKL